MLLLGSFFIFFLEDVGFLWLSSEFTTATLMEEKNIKERERERNNNTTKSPINGGRRKASK